VSYFNEVSQNPLHDPTTHYAIEVTKGKVIASKAVKQACERHMKDLERGDDFIYRFDRKRADHIFKFYEKFVRHSKGELAGKTVTLEPWQKFILGSLLGWVRKDDGRRRYTLAYIQMARKNGKSLLSSGLMLYLFMVDQANGGGAEVYTASIKKDTAKIVWNDCMRMVKASPTLKRHVRVQESYSTLTCGNNVLKALSADSAQDGLNIAGYSLDECHLLPNSAMYDVLVSATGAKLSPLGFLITTAGESKGGTSWCYTFYEYCKQVLQNIVDNDNLFIFIAEQDNQDEIHDRTMWLKSNPNLNVSVTTDSLEQAYKRAVDGGEMDNFLIKHMNLWIQRKDAYFPIARLDDRPLPQLEGMECYLGIDLASKLDLNSVTAVFPLENERYAVLNHNFMPEDTIYQREVQDKVPYRRWAKDGLITLTPGEVVDVEFIYNYIIELSKKYTVISAGFDPWNATALMTKTANAGITTVEVRQGYKTLSEPTKYIKELMLQGKIITGNNPLFKWSCANAVGKFDSSENVLLDKAKSINRIDPIASTVVAMTEAILHNERYDINKHILNNEYSIWGK